MSVITTQAGWRRTRKAGELLWCRTCLKLSYLFTEPKDDGSDCQCYDSGDYVFQDEVNQSNVTYMLSGNIRVLNTERNVVWEFSLVCHGEASLWQVFCYKVKERIDTSAYNLIFHMLGVNNQRV